MNLSIEHLNKTKPFPTGDVYKAYIDHEVDVVMEEFPGNHRNLVWEMIAKTFLKEEKEARDVAIADIKQHIEEIKSSKVSV